MTATEYPPHGPNSNRNLDLGRREAYSPVRSRGNFFEKTGAAENHRRVM